MKNEPINFGGNLAKEKPNLLLKRHARYQNTFRPHKIFRNWKIGYQVPWGFIFEVALLVLTFVFGNLHQNYVISFGSDFAKIVDNYFLYDFGFEEEDGKIEDMVTISSKKQFFNISSTLAKRIFDFPNEYPCSKKISSENIFELKITTLKSDSLYFLIDQSNLSTFNSLIESYINNFSLIILNAPYTMEINNDEIEADVNVSIIFTLNKVSRVVLLAVKHTLVPRFPIASYVDILNRPLLLTSILECLISIICITDSIIYIIRLRSYSIQKANENFLKFRSIFWSKFDKWTIFSIITHIISIISNICYIFSGQNYTTSLSLPMILMSFSTSFICILIIRYLKQNDLIGEFISVIFEALKQIFLFLFGCSFITIGYLVLGSSILGSYDENFRTIIIAAEALIGVIHGDSIYDMFSSSQKRAEIPDWLAVIFWSIWVFYSLTIMCNISISIFEDVLDKKIYEPEEKKKMEDNDEELELESFLLPLPLCLGEEQIYM